MRGLPNGMLSRQGLIIGQLLVTVLLTSLLAYQALDAGRSHRETARAVMSDYATLGCREFNSVVINALGSYGSRPFLRQFEDLAWPNLPKPSDLDFESIYNISLDNFDPPIKLSFARFDISSNTFFLDGDHSPSLLGPIYLAELQKVNYDDRWPMAFSFPPDQESLLIYTLADRETKRYEGLILDMNLLRSFFDTLYARRALVPVTEKNAGLLQLEVLGPHGEFYSAGDVQEGIEAELELGYGMKDMRARITLDLTRADALIIGGVPGSRLPLLLSLLLVTIGLVVITILLLRRERELSVRQADSLAGISHELRTPLAQIQMFAETLALGRVRDEDEQQRAMKIILGESRRMGDLVENVIRFSSALQGISKQPLEKVDIFEAIHEQTHYFKQVSPHHAQRFKLELETTPTIWAQPRFLQRMLRNLIDNALKYSPSDTPIIIGTQQADKYVQIFVEDHGPGIPAPWRRRVWERFTRLPGHRNSAVAGSGIGLWLVRELAAAQGAIVRVKEGSQGGARFELDFLIADQKNPGEHVK